MKKIPVKYYFMLVFLVSWFGLWCVMGTEGFLGMNPVDEALMPALMGAMLLGPLVSSLMLLIIYRGKGGVLDLLKWLGQWRCSIKWYLLAIFAAPIFSTLTALILIPFSEGFTPLILMGDHKLELVVGGLMGGLLAGLIEEIGWTGIVTPNMSEKRSWVVNALILGLLWGLWHMPLFLTPDPEGKMPLFILVAVRLFTQLPVFRVLMVGLYRRTQNLLVIVVMHMSLTASTLVFQTVPLSGMASLAYNLLWSLICILFILGFHCCQKRNPLVK